MRPASRGELGAVAGHEIDRLEIDAEPVGHDLPEARLVPLPARLRAHA